jgi:hypothetical protein
MEITNETTDVLSARKSKLFPFFHEIDKQDRLDNSEPTGEERETAAQDWEDCRYMIEYRKNSGWDSKAIRGMKIFNVVQTMQPDDEISRIFLGNTRMIIDKGIEQMSEGEPDFDFEPFGPSDHTKTIIWKHLVKMNLSNCDYKLHQGKFFRDYFVMGSGVFDTYIDFPQRTIRVPNPAWPGGYEPIVIQDRRRPKVGVRAVNPLNCWRNPNIDTPSQVPSCLRRRKVTWNQFAQEFGRCNDTNGDSMYENLEKIAKGSHVCLYYYQDELRDIYRIYAKSFGTESDGKATSPEMDSLGVRILNKPLKIHERMKDKVVYSSTGLNIPGLCSLRWGTFFDVYDKDYSGEQSVYGMGLPQRIEGEDTALQTMFNLYLDSERWAGTVALNYKGSQADSYMDVDANRLYGGELIDGEITPMPLGISRPNAFTSFQEVINNSTIPSTGINHQQMTGDTSKTAFEFAQRIKAANRGAEQRLSRMESEVFKPVGTLMLANSLTVLTVSDYEDMTEEQVAAAKESIKTGKKPLADYKDLNGEKPKRKVIQYIPMKGEKFREDFTVTKKRKLDYNANYTKTGNTTNTLIPDKSMKVETSYVPMTEEYVYPTEYIESGMLPDCIVDSKRMLGDMKAQDVQNWQAATNFLLQLMQAGYKNIDMDKLAAGTLEFAGIDAGKMLNTDTGSSELLTKVKDLITQMQDPAAGQNAQPTQAMPAAPTPMPAAPNPASHPLAAVASGTL